MLKQMEQAFMVRGQAFCPARRFTAMLLAASLVLSMLSTLAFAQDETPGGTTGTNMVVDSGTPAPLILADVVAMVNELRDLDLTNKTAVLEKQDAINKIKDARDALSTADRAAFNELAEKTRLDELTEALAKFLREDRPALTSDDVGPMLDALTDLSLSDRVEMLAAKAKIVAALKAYRDLTEGEKNYLTEEQRVFAEKLNDALKAYNEASATPAEIAELIARLAAIADAGEAPDADAVKAARAAYDALTDEEKAAFDADTLALLVMLEAALAAVPMAGDAITIEVSDGTTTKTGGGIDLAAAVAASTLTANTITSLKITAGEVTAADWEYFAGGTPGSSSSPFTALTTFEVADDVAVTAVADIPNGETGAYPAAIFPNSIVTVTIPQAISVGNSVFNNCQKLTEVNLLAVTSIGKEAFKNCLLLPKVSLPNATDIGDAAFQFCYKLTEASMPKATGIGEKTFQNCSVLTSVDIFAAATIAPSAFSNCRKLTKLTLGTTVPTVTDVNAFSSCPTTRSLAIVDVDGNALTNPTTLATAIAAYDAVSDGISGSTATDNLWYGWTLPAAPELPKIAIQVNGNAAVGGASLSDAVSKCGVTAINITALKITAGEVTPADWTWFSSGTYNHVLRSLTDFTVDAAVASVADIPNGSNSKGIFPSTIVTVTIPQSIKIGAFAFYQCTKLTTANFPAATSVGDSAFYNCIALAGASFPAVTSIARSAFNGCKVLTGASFPAATSIGDNAFSGCIALTSPSFPVAKSIGTYAFYNCLQLAAVEFPAAESIGATAFSGCKALTSPSFPVAKTIDGSAFNGCTALTTVSLPAATSIGAYAFDGCGVLTSASFPAATSIGAMAFNGCAALATLRLPAAPPKLLNINAFTGCPADRNVVFVNVDGTTELTGADLSNAITNYDKVVIPDTGTDTDGLWYGWKVREPVAAAKITIQVNGGAAVGGDSLANAVGKALNGAAATTIIALKITAGEVTPADWNALKTTLPALQTFEVDAAVPDANVVDIPDGNAALFPSTITTVTIPQAIKVGNKAFYNCAQLTGVSLPKVTTIGKEAFKNCLLLPKVSLPKVTSIGDSAFESCAVLTTVSLPEAINIGAYAFYVCEALASVSLPEATSIGNYAFYGCKVLASVSLPEATSIGNYAFYGCKALLSVSLPEATSIRDYAFDSCTALTSVSLPKVTAIGDRAFWNCTALTSVSLPVVQTIGNSAFSGCDNLVTLTLGTNVPKVGQQVFSYCPQPRSLVIVGADGITPLTGDALATAIAAYDKAVSPDTGTDTDGLWYGCTLPAAPAAAKITVTVNGDAAVGGESLSDAVGKALNGAAATTITALKITAGEVTPADWTALKTTLPKLQTFEIAETSAVTKVDNIPDGLSSAFPTSITSVTIPQAITVGKYAFSGCKALTTATLPKTTSVGERAFQGCEALATVTLSAAKTISTSAFSNCAALATITLPAAETIGENAFFKCTALTSVSLPAATNIGAFAFNGCAALTTANLPKTTSIGRSAFVECTKLATLKLGTTVPAVPDISVFGDCAATRNLVIVGADGITPLTGDALATAIADYDKVGYPDTGTDADGLWWGWQMREPVAAAKITITVNGGAAVGGASLEDAVNNALNGAAASTITTLKITAGEVTADDWTDLKEALPALQTFAIDAVVTKVANIQDFADSIFPTTITSVTIPQVIEVGSSSFKDCTSLASVSLSAAKTIGMWAFSGCSTLSEVNLPAVTDIGGVAFFNCKALATLKLPAAPPNVGSNAFLNCPPTRSVVIVDTDGTPLIGTDLTNAQKAYDDVTADGNIAGDSKWYGWALSAAPAAGGITIEVFDGTSTKTASGADLAAAVAASGVAQPHRITSLKITAGTVTAADWSALKTALTTQQPSTPPALTTLEIAEAVTVADIPSVAFNAHMFPGRIASVTIPQAIKVGDYAFYNYGGLTTLNLPKATSIGQEAFFSCGLTAVDLSAATDIGKMAFADCVKLTSITLPKATSIGVEAFYGCKALADITLPEATSIGEKAFRNCVKLGSITLPKATRIGKQAFDYCKALTTVSLPAAIEIGEFAFALCDALTTLKLPAAPPTVSHVNAFSDCPKTNTLVIVNADGDVLTDPDAMADAQKAYDDVTANGNILGDGKWYGWKLGEPVSTDNITITVEMGSEVRANIGSNNLPNAVLKSGLPQYEITKLTITAGEVTDADWGYIADNRNTKLSSLTDFTISASIPDSKVANISDVSQYNEGFPSTLKSVTIPQKIEIGSEVFLHCYNLTQVNIPKATKLGEEAFAYCEKLEAVSFPDLTEIGRDALSCSKLKSLTLGATPPKVLYNATFEGCPEDRTLTIAGVTGDALIAAQKEYDKVQDGRGGTDTDGLWYGWKIGGGAPVKPGGTAPGGKLEAPLTQDKVDNVFGAGNATLDNTVSPPKITLDNSITTEKPIEIETNVDIDLGGNTITGKPGEPPLIIGDGSHVNIGGSGTVSGGDNPGGTGGSGITGGTGGSITIGGGVTVEGGDGATGGAGVESGGNVSVDGSVTGGNGSSGAGGDGVDTSGGNGNITINPGGSASGGNGNNGGNGVTSGGNVSVDGNVSGGNGSSGAGGDGVDTSGGNGNIIIGGSGSATGGNSTGGGGSGGDGTNSGGNTIINGGAAGGNGNGSGSGGNGTTAGSGSTIINNGGSASGGSGGSSGGAGGNGSTSTGSGNIVVDGGATGGNGGNGSSGGNGGNGTQTDNGATVIHPGGSTSGGNGGSGSSGSGGAGGNGSTSTGGGNISVDGGASGGNGGSGSTGGTGGNGTQTGGGTVVGGGGSATGGTGGSGSNTGGNGGNGTATSGSSTTINGDATGGAGGSGTSGTNGNGGNGGNGANQGSGLVNGSGNATGGNGGSGAGSGSGGAGGSGVGGGATAGDNLTTKDGISAKVEVVGDANVEVKLPDVAKTVDAVLTQDEKDDPTITDVKVTLKVDDKTAAKPDAAAVESQKPANSIIGAFFDITLQKTITKNNVAGSPETVTNVPSGVVTITIEIPAGMRDGVENSYVVIRVHNGTAQTLATTQSGNELTFETDKFSTYAIAYEKSAAPPTPPTSNSGGGSGGSGGSSDNGAYDFWMRVKEKIRKADSGDVIKVNARGYDKVPRSVMDALRKNSGVSLVITWSGKTVTIPAGKTQKNESGRIYWPLSKLAELYADVAEDAVLKPVAGTNPETGGEMKYIPATGGGEVITLEAPAPVMENAAAKQADALEHANIAADAAQPNAMAGIAQPDAMAGAAQPNAPALITPPDAGFEQDAFAGTPDAKTASEGNLAGLAAAVLLLAAATAGSVWYWKRRTAKRL